MQTIKWEAPITQGGKMATVEVVDNFEDWFNLVADKNEVDFDNEGKLIIPSFVKLDPERKRQWVEALRSGEYNQGSGRLKALDIEFEYPSDIWWDDPEYSENVQTLIKGTEYCCLGVAAEVWDKDQWNEVELTSLIEDGSLGLEYEVWQKGGESEGFLSATFAAEYGLTDRIQNFLAYANDTIKWNFNQIADWIEENL